MGLAPGFAVLAALLLAPRADGLYVASSVDSLQHILGEYGLVTPVSTDAEGRFLSHAVSAGQLHRRRRRETAAAEHWEEDEEEDQAERANRLFYNVTVFGRELHLRLRLNSRLVAPGAKMEWQEDSNGSRSEPLLGDCLYVGDVTGMKGASVAISNCDGLDRLLYCKSLIEWPYFCCQFHAGPTPETDRLGWDISGWLRQGCHIKFLTKVRLEFGNKWK